jgi:hypothetical protein
MNSVSKLFFVSGVGLIVAGSVVGEVAHQLVGGFPWGGVISISTGVWCLLEGVRVHVKEKVKNFG